MAILDQVLHGRLELGLVSGISPESFNHFSHYLDSRTETYEKRRHLTTELISLIKAAFATEGPFNFDGPYHQYQNVKLSVEPVQRPCPPLRMQSRDAETLRFLAQEGVNTGYVLFFPREEAAPRYREYLRLWKEAGHQQPPNIGYWTLVYVDETDDLAVQKAAPHIIHAFSQVFGVGDAGFETQARLVETFDKRGEHGSAEIARNMSNVEYLLERNLVFVGSPETVVRQIRDAATEGMFNSVFAEFNIGSLEEEDLMRSIRLFGTQVMTELRSFEPY